MDAYKEFQGKTLDSAIEAACSYFNSAREKLEIEIVNDAKTGIFGLVGAKKAKIRARRMQLNFEAGVLNGGEGTGTADGRDRKKPSSGRNEKPRDEQRRERGEQRPREERSEKSRVQNGQEGAQQAAPESRSRQGVKDADRAQGKGRPERRAEKPAEKHLGAEAGTETSGSEKGRGRQKPEAQSEARTEHSEARSESRNDKSRRQDRGRGSRPSRQQDETAAPRAEAPVNGEQAAQEGSATEEERSGSRRSRGGRRRPRGGRGRGGRKEEGTADGVTSAEGDAAPDDFAAFGSEGDLMNGAGFGAGFDADFEDDSMDDILREPMAEANLDELDKELLLSVVTEAVKRMVVPVIGETPVEAVIEENRVKVTVSSGDNSGLLIGREGQTLASFQYLVNRIVAKRMGVAVRVQLDTGDYRERQDDKLREIALHLADKAKTLGKPQSTRPLSSYHRRIVHLALQEDDEIQTRSKGDGPMKRVIIGRKRKSAQ
ncbi:protein jag [Desulfovibrio psychrotolerans]|uniref:RNA-binding protein KhpB n=1 Tax=Desulfovibrio psychrotolerans TaxID=415242 RepID=A0A7J0BR92_9BACT|nr:protein jag [Desulfovibrio psychrotolerans]GFM35731.1 protein jag [Desulfovibrio psychrotolerans]